MVATVSGAAQMPEACPVTVEPWTVVAEPGTKADEAGEEVAGGRTNVDVG